MISIAVTTNDPTATANPPSGGASVARKAAPGVDHATLIGIPVRKLSTMAQTPLAIDTAISPDAVSVGDAPTERRP